MKSSCRTGQFREVKYRCGPQGPTQTLQGPWQPLINTLPAGAGTSLTVAVRGKTNKTQSGSPGKIGSRAWLAAYGAASGLPSRIRGSQRAGETLVGLSGEEVAEQAARRSQKEVLNKVV